jgi:hypothetical protein
MDLENESASVDIIEDVVRNPLDLGRLGLWMMSPDGNPSNFPQVMPEWSINRWILFVFNGIPRDRRIGYGERYVSLMRRWQRNMKELADVKANLAWYDRHKDDEDQGPRR